VLGLIFLRYADHRFSIAEKELSGKGTGRRTIGKEDYQAKGVMFLPPAARFSKLLALPEGENIGKAINDAMKAVEAENDNLKACCRRPTQDRYSTLVSLMKNLSALSVDAEGDTFGKIYEYSSATLHVQRDKKEASSSHRPRWLQLIVQITSRFTGAYSIPRRVRVVCTSRALTSSKPTRVILPRRFPFTAKNVSMAKELACMAHERTSSTDELLFGHTGKREI